MHIVSVIEDGSVGDTTVRVIYTDDAREQEYRLTLSGDRAAAVLEANTKEERRKAVTSGVEAELAEAAKVQAPVEHAAEMVSEAKSQARSMAVALAAREAACVERERNAENVAYIVAAQGAELQRQELALVEVNAARADAERIVKFANERMRGLMDLVQSVDAELAARQAAQQQASKDAELAALVAAVKAEIMAELKAAQ